MADRLQDEQNRTRQLKAAKTDQEDANATPSGCLMGARNAQEQAEEDLARQRVRCETLQQQATELASDVTQARHERDQDERTLFVLVPGVTFVSAWVTSRQFGGFAAGRLASDALAGGGPLLPVLVHCIARTEEHGVDLFCLLEAAIVRFCSSPFDPRCSSSLPALRLLGNFTAAVLVFRLQRIRRSTSGKNAPVRGR
ncbi:hypothetical protein ABMX48_36340 [Streptomyces cavourensis]